MKAVSSAEMKKIENEAITDIGIPSLVLMEMAALKFSQRCFDVIKNNKYSKIVVFAGKGNNGGDGLAFCRHICQKSNLFRRFNIKVVFIGDKYKASYECETQLNILENLIKNGLPIEIVFIDENMNFDIASEISNADLIVDAIIGTGLKYDIRNNISSIIDIINKCNCTVASVDCPSGIDSDSGAVLGNAVKADFTVTFHLPKTGLLINQGPLYTGKLFIEDINIPYGLEENIKTNILSYQEAKNFIPKRPKNANKGTFGKVFIFAGCENMPGACVIASKSAYRAGAGLVYSCSVKNVCEVVRNHIPEAITKVLPDKNGYLCSESFNNIDFNDADCIIVGPGLGRSESIFGFIQKMAESVKVPIIIDADGLNAISNDLSILYKINAPCIITPHLGEMSRLIGKSKEDIKNNILEEAKNFAQKYNVIVVLKDFRTVIADPSGNLYINTSGSSVLAKGGSGDSLTGIIAALIAQNTDCFYAAVLASFVLGLAGERIEENYGTFGTLARECSDFVSIILNELH